ncbi:TRAP transporter small permease [Yoonia sp. BS5-3]|uniref:TRAP transporter small permease protein n=1 Tax=Yoonia phaeophyticola TaxID=3137369 RepID=A0ABZ2V827_9RHOB
MSGRNALIHWIEKTLDAIRTACILVGSIGVIVLIVTHGWLVFGRYVMNDTPTWVERLGLLLIFYVVFLGAAAGVREESHLGVTMFRDMLPAPLQKVGIILIDLIMAGFGAIMFLAGVELVQFGWDSQVPMLNIPESFRTLPITIFCALVCLICSARALVRVLTFVEWDPNATAKQPIEES